MNRCDSLWLWRTRSFLLAVLLLLWIQHCHLLSAMSGNLLNISDRQLAANPWRAGEFQMYYVRFPGQCFLFDSGYDWPVLGTWQPKHVVFSHSVRTNQVLWVIFTSSKLFLDHFCEFFSYSRCSTRCWQTVACRYCLKWRHIYDIAFLSDFCKICF